MGPRPPLLSGVLWIDGGHWLPYAVLFTVFHATAEHWLGTLRWLAVAALAHVLAVLLGEGVLGWAVRYGDASQSAGNTLEVGVSYALAGVVAVLTYRVPHPWRYVYAFAVLVFYGVPLAADGRTVTDLGHVTAVLTGLACYRLTRGAPPHGSAGPLPTEARGPSQGKREAPPRRRRNAPPRSNVPPHIRSAPHRRPGNQRHRTGTQGHHEHRQQRQYRQRRHIVLVRAGGHLHPREPLPGDASADVCIVGGGYTGLWTAYYLKKAVPFLNITVLEAKFCGYGASGRNGGWLYNGIAGRERYAKLHGHDAAVRLQKAMNETVGEVVRAAAEEKIDADIHQGGVLEVAHTPAQLARLKDFHSVEIAFGETDRVLRGARETAERIRVTGAVGSTWTPHGARLHPPSWSRGSRTPWRRSGSPSTSRHRSPRSSPSTRSPRTARSAPRTSCAAPRASRRVSRGSSGPGSR